MMNIESWKVLEQDLRKRMKGALDAFNHSLSGLRAGRASPSLLDTVKVSLYGSIMPINQLATVSASDARSLLIQVWSKDSVKEIEKAIINSGLGLNPVTEGQVIRINLPDLNEERRKELVKKAKEYLESAKIALRNIRRDIIEEVKSMEKNKEISEDDSKDYAVEVQKITDEFTSECTKLLELKSKEILTI